MSNGTSPERTSVVQCCGEAGNGPLAAELGHAAVSLHSKGVVKMSVQVSDYNRRFLQVGGARFEADLLPTGDALALIAVRASHPVCEVVAAPGHQRWAPGQLQPALC